MGAVVWLLDLDCNGTILRFAQRAVSVTDADGNAYAYGDGLGPVVVEYSAETGPSGRSIAIRIGSPPSGTTWGALRAAGVPLAGARATLRRWRVGWTLEQAEVHVRGPLEDVERGTRTDPLQASLNSAPWGDGTRVVPERQAIGPLTWPVASSYETDQQVVGALPALIVGYPGDMYFPTRKGTEVYAPTNTAVQGPPVKPVSRIHYWAELAEGAPGLLVEWNKHTIASLSSKLVFAAHEVVATEAIVWDQSDARWDTFDVAHTTNLEGATVAYVDWGSGKFVKPKLGHEYWVILLPEYGGGLPSDKGGTMDRLGEFLAWLLARMNVDTAVAMQHAQRDALDAYKVQLVYNGDGTVWDLIRSEILPVFPVRYVEAPDIEGGWLQPYPRATADEVVDRLHVERDGLEVVSSIKEDTRRIANHLVLTYAPGLGGFQKSATLTDETDSSSASQRGNALCARSQDLYERRAKTIPARMIADEATAWQVLREQAEQLAMPIEDVHVLATNDRLDGLRLLQVVELTATRHDIDDAVRCVVESIVYEDANVRAGLRIKREAR